METNEKWYIRGNYNHPELVRQELIKRGAVTDITCYGYCEENSIYFIVDGIVFCRFEQSNSGQHIVKNWKEVKVTKSQFKPFDKVLVCQGEGHYWMATFFSSYDKELTDAKYPYFAGGLFRYKYCIPYEGNEHLNGVRCKPKDIEKYDFE